MARENYTAFSLSKNDILLHYEELGEIDIKISITLQLVADYIQSFSGVSKEYAKKEALSMRDPIKGWAAVMDDDERFYGWCKYQFFNLATKRRAQNRECALFWVENGSVRINNLKTKESALRAFKRLAGADRSACVYLKKTNGRGLWQNPWLKHRADELIKYVEEKYLEKEPDELTKCRRQRCVPSCEKCLRFETCATRRKK